MTTPIENFKGILSYMVEDIDRSIRLSKYNKEELTSIFGKNNRRFRGEFFYYVWDVEFEGEKYTIYTHSEKGTCIEIEAGLEEEKSEEIKKFLKYLEANFNGTGNS